MLSMGKSTISMAIFNSKLLVITRPGISDLPNVEMAIWRIYPGTNATRAPRQSELMKRDERREVGGIEG